MSAVPGEEWERSPEEGANCCSRTFFLWTTPIFKRGSAKVTDKEGKLVPYHLNEVDMFPLVKDDMAAPLVQEFERCYNEEPSDFHGAWRTLKAMYWGEFFWVAVIKFINSSLQFIPPILLNLFLERLERFTDGDTTNQPEDWETYVIAVAMFLVLSFKTLTENAYFHGSTRVGFKVRSTLTTAVYRKALRLSPASRQGTKEGSIVQLMNVDAERFNATLPMLANLWDGLYQIIGYMTLLTIYIGPAASFSGLGSMLLLIPINLCMHGRLTGLRRSISRLTDERVQATNEALQGVRAIKLYGWEAAFENLIAGIRTRELKVVKAAAVTNAAVMTFMQTAPILVAIVTLLVYAVTSPTFSPATVFTALSVLSSLRFPLMFYPMVIFLTSAASVSLARIERFLAAPEVTAEGRTVGASSAASHPARPSSVEKTPSSAAAASSSSSSSSDAAAKRGAAMAAQKDAAVAVSDGRFWWSDPSRPVVDLLGEKEKEQKKSKKGDAPKDQAAASKASDAKGGAPAAAAAASTAVATAADEEEAADDNGNVRVAQVPILDGVHFGVPRGKLLAIVGAVGSGKSALCSALLGELHREQGTVTVDGSVAYCAQRSWILNATLQKNVTFAEDFDEKRYRDTIRACQLEPDLELLPAGDQTEIGERGVNLSGGQKQRVSVARACYSRADIVILDDVLSALDPEVGARLFESCILGSMSGRTRIMVTNQVHVLEHCDYILELEQDANGTAHVARFGTFRDLMADTVFRTRVEEYAASAAAKHAAELQAEKDAAAAADEEEGEASSSASSSSASSATSSSSAGAAGAADDDDDDDADAKAAVSDSAAASGDAGESASAESKEASSSRRGSQSAATEATDAAASSSSKPSSGDTGKLMSTETKEQGAVAMRFYAEWLRAGSGSCWAAMGVLLVVASLLSQIGTLGSNFWISVWSSDPDYTLMPLGGYMGVFAAIGVGAAIIGMGRMLLFVSAGMQASRQMHSKLFHSVIYAPMAFFDTTPLGRVMARFSKDMDAVDFNLASQLSMLAMTFFLIIGSVASIIVATPWFAVAVPPLAVIYWRVSQYFRNVSRECKRVDSVTRSPIYAHFGESLGGLSTIRAYGEAQRFSQLNEQYVNANAAAWYTLRACDRWISVRLETLGNIIVLLSALLAAAAAASVPAAQAPSSGGVSLASLAGFALSYSLAITSVLNWAIRTLAETENMMNSVERVVLTTEETPQEPKGEPKGAPAVEDAWASAGRIEFRDVRMRYRKEAPEVLHGVSFTINEGEKVGIVGRSGSGKSTIMQVLFRIPVDECVTGSVMVDGRDTRSVGLHTLRHRLSIIPQESVMFSGQLRDNLDPSGEVRERAKATGEDADAKMLRALEDVGLTETVEKKGGLDAPVAEFGENWSAGERQLLSLARVLLRDSKILCLDEVSSSVDSDTDKRMHETILKRFADRTVLTIAHRLHTVIKSDRVLVMHDGELAEFDHPHTLLTTPGSRFASLVADTGAAAEGLRELAKQSWEEKHGATSQRSIDAAVQA